MCEYKKLITIFLLLQMKFVGMLMVFTSLLHRDIKQLKIIGLWKMTPCNLIKSYQHCGGNRYVHLHFIYPEISSTKFFKTLLLFHQATQHHILENQSSYSPPWEHSSIINAAECKLHRRQMDLAFRMWCSIAGCVVPTIWKESVFPLKGQVGK